MMPIVATGAFSYFKHFEEGLVRPIQWTSYRALADPETDGPGEWKAHHEQEVQRDHLP